MFKELFEPMKLYLGKGIYPYPLIHKREVVEKYGIEIAEQVVNLFNDFSHPIISIEMDEIKREEIGRTRFLKKYPNCDKEMLELLLWGFNCRYPVR